MPAKGESAQCGLGVEPALGVSPAESLRWLWKQRDRIRSPSQAPGNLVEGRKSFQLGVRLESSPGKDETLESIHLLWIFSLMFSCCFV